MKKTDQKPLVLMAFGFACGLGAMQDQDQKQGDGLSDSGDNLPGNSIVGIGMNNGGTIFSGSFLAPDLKESPLPPSMQFIPTKRQYNKLKKKLMKSVPSDHSTSTDAPNKH